VADRAIPPLTAQHVASFEASEEEGSLAARLERIADQAPDKLAVQDGERLLTFAELDQTANRIAHCILQRGCESDRMVAFLLEHGEPQIVALWGILKAGKGFLALSTDLPAARHAYMLDDAEARLIVTNNRNLARARALAQDTRLIINLDHLPADLPVERPGIAIPPDRIAWISYTSGSTGTPKGAVHTQRSLLHCAWSAGACLPVYRDDRCAYIVPISYAAACIPLFVASLYQASVHCYDLMQEDFGRFAEWLRAQAISVLFTVPSVFRRWASTLQEGAQLPALRLLLLGGERLYGHDAQLVGRLLPDSRLTNLYGTSESLVTSSHRVDTSRAYPGRVPVGYMHPGYEVSVLDDAGQPVPQGETGEIVLKSRYLSPGYWHMPAQTAAV